jgi:hypothetical protein
MAGPFATWGVHSLTALSFYMFTTYFATYLQLVGQPDPRTIAAGDHRGVAVRRRRPPTGAFSTGSGGARPSALPACG